MKVAGVQGRHVQILQTLVSREALRSTMNSQSRFDGESSQWHQHEFKHIAHCILHPGIDRASENLGTAHYGHTASRGPAPAGCLIGLARYYICAKPQGAAPCRLLATRGEGLSPQGIPGACQPCLHLMPIDSLRSLSWLVSKAPQPWALGYSVPGLTMFCGTSLLFHESSVCHMSVHHEK